MAIAPNTTIATSTGFGHAWPSQASLAERVLQGRRKITEDPIVDEGEQLLDSGITRGLLADADAVRSTDALNAKVTEWVRSSTGHWNELRTLHQLLSAVSVHYETGATGPTSFDEKPRDSQPAPTVRSFADLADELTADVPDSEWDKVPTDLVRNLDHYLYGAPKEDE